MGDVLCVPALRPPLVARPHALRVPRVGCIGPSVTVGGMVDVTGPRTSQVARPCWGRRLPASGWQGLAGLGVSASPLTKLGSRTVGGGARVFGSNVGLLVGGASSYVAGSGAVVSGPGLA